MKVPRSAFGVLAAASLLAPSAFGDVSGRWFGTVVVRTVTEIGSNNSQSAANFTRSDQKVEGVVTYDVDGSGPGSYSVRGSALHKMTGHEVDTFPCFKGGQGTQTVDTGMNMTGEASQSGTVPANAAAVNVVANADGTYGLSVPAIPEVPVAVQGAMTMSSRASCDRKAYSSSTPMAARDSVGVPGIDFIGTAPKGGANPDVLAGSYSTVVAGAEKVEVHWSLSRKPGKLKAKTTKTVYSIQRGDKVTLDASPSTGAIDEYDWTLMPGPDCSLQAGLLPPPALTFAPMKGKTVTFTALCGVFASLTVKSGSDSATNAAVVSVAPRTGWKTSISPPAKTHGTFSAGFVKENAFLGKNRCTLDTVEDSSHWLHTSKTGTWEGDGYTLTRISEPGAPFDGYWYVSVQTLRISRMSYHSSALLKGGVLSDLNSGKSGNPADLAVLLAQVDAHEDAHTILVQEYFAQNGPDWDPAARIESLFYSSHGDATTSADYAVRDAESELDATDWETLVGRRLMTDARFNRSGWIKVPTLGGPDVRWNIASFATLQSAAEGIPPPGATPAPPPSGPRQVQTGDPPVTVPLTGGPESGSAPASDQ